MIKEAGEAAPSECSQCEREKQISESEISGKAERVCRPTCKPSAEKAETVQDGWPEQLCQPALGSSERPASVNKVQYNRRRHMASTLGLHMHAHAYMQSWAHLQTQCALHL